MRYVGGRSERIPLPNGYFDFVSCLNALDHVDGFDRTIAEIKRVTKTAAFFWLGSKLTTRQPRPNHRSYPKNDMAQLAPEFRTISSFKVGTPVDHDLHGAVLCREPAHQTGQPKIYVAKMQR